MPVPGDRDATLGLHRGYVGVQSVQRYVYLAHGRASVETSPRFVPELV